MALRSCLRILALTLIAGCGNPTGPAIVGRWADLGIQLVATDSAAELYLPCIRPIRLTPIVRGPTGVIWFTAAGRDPSNTFDLTFVGRFRGDTLAGTATWVVPGRPLYVTRPVMTPDGVYATGPFVCPAVARAA
jgi:hypothetical protein